MINETKEVEAWTPEVIRSQVAEYTGGREQLSDAAVAVLISFFELDEEDRAAVLKAVPAFVCAECGAPSCLHGYSDE